MAVILTFSVLSLLWVALCGRGQEPFLYFVFQKIRQKERHACARLSVDQLSKRQAAVRVSRAVASAGASLPRIKARRIGLITNNASSAAVALSATAITKTACQP